MPTPGGLKPVLVILVSSASIFFMIALGLIASQRLQPLPARESLAFASIETTTAQDPGLTTWRARDGAELGVRHYPGPETGPLVVVVHGSGWHGGGYTALGASLAEEYGFEVLIPDLRGHGPAPMRRGDVDYVGQLEDDLADLILAYGGTERPVYMVGHSSGGGLTIRFAGGAHGHMLDKAVLIAPFLKYNAPTAREDGGGWSHVLVRRIIGLSMLNAVGIHALDHLHVIQFRFPDSVLHGPQGANATQSYSYRLNTSFAPRADYLADAARLPPFLLIAGREDEAFRAEAYEPTLAAATPRGQYMLIGGANHLGILSDRDAHAAIGTFLREAPSGVADG